jgi:hypothetical protein
MSEFDSKRLTPEQAAELAQAGKEAAIAGRAISETLLHVGWLWSQAAKQRIDYEQRLHDLQLIVPDEDDRAAYIEAAGGDLKRAFELAAHGIPPQLAIDLAPLRMSLSAMASIANPVRRQRRPAWLRDLAWTIPCHRLQPEYAGWKRPIWRGTDDWPADTIDLLAAADTYWRRTIVIRVPGRRYLVIAIPIRRKHT